MPTYNFELALAFGSISTSDHQGYLAGPSDSNTALKSGFLFSKNALTPSVWSFPRNIWYKIPDSSKCASSGDSGPRHINPRFNTDAMGLTVSAISVASSSARGSTRAGSGSVSANRGPKWRELGGKTPPVLTRYMARARPTRRGRKYEEQDSMVMPRRAKTKPYLEVSWAILVVSLVLLSHGS